MILLLQLLKHWTSIILLKSIKSFNFILYYISDCMHCECGVKWFSILSCQNNTTQDSIVRTQDSSLWKCLADALHNFHMYEFWSIGNGTEVNAWSDRWLIYGKSVEELGIVVPDTMKGMKVHDLVDSSGSWKLDILSDWLPPNIINKLFAIVPPNNTTTADKRAWRGTKDGNFSIASAYTLLCK
jgi:hypothetical protein